MQKLIHGVVQRNMLRWMTDEIDSGEEKTDHSYDYKIKLFVS